MWFDRLLSDCEKGSCPAGYFVSSLLYPLTDISIDGYIMQNAYFSSLKSQDESSKLTDDDRYFRAVDRIKAVLNCAIPPTLGEDTFNIDTAEVFKNISNDTAYHGARKRKAYWTYMMNGTDDDYRHFCKATSFIDTVHSISSKTSITRSDIQKMRQLLQDNSHIANAIDLYRLCYIRKLSY